MSISPPLNAHEIAYLRKFAVSRRMGLWCQWEPAKDGTAIKWNGVEKFYYAAEWMTTSSTCS